MRRYLLLLALIPAIPNVAWGATYYCDLDKTADGAGTLADPFRYAQVFNKSDWQTGDDLFFKAGSSYVLTADDQYFRARWSGTAQDPAVIGAYDPDTGNHELGSHPRPILDGTEQNTYVTQWNGLITLSGPQQAWDDDPCCVRYVTIRDIHLKNSGHSGIVGNGPDYITISNCYTEKTRASGIVITRGHHLLFENNTVEKAGWNQTACSGGIVVGSNDQCDWGSQGDPCPPETFPAYNNIIRNNIVFDSRCEGIGAYKMGRHTTIDGNIVYDCKNVGIYMDGRENDIVIRDNVVYATPDSIFGSRMWMGIQHYMETQRCCGGAPTDDCYPDIQNWNYYWATDSGPTITGNMVAGCENGISLSYEWESDYESSCSPYKRFALVDNNTLVDNDNNLAFTAYADYFSDNQVKNNLSALFTAGLQHVRHSNANGVFFDRNLYFGETPPTDAAANGMVLGDPLLAKTTGWRALTRGGVSAGDFAIAEGSAARDAGVPNTTVVDRNGDQLSVGNAHVCNMNESYDTVYDVQGQPISVVSIDSDTTLTVTGAHAAAIVSGDGLFYRAPVDGAIDIGADEWGEPGPGGAGGGGTGGAATGGSGGAAGTGGSSASPSAASDDEGGCGCRVGADQPARAPWSSAGVLGLVLALVRRRRRSSSPAPRRRG